MAQRTRCEAKLVANHHTSEMCFKSVINRFKVSTNISALELLGAPHSWNEREWAAKYFHIWSRNFYSWLCQLDLDMAAEAFPSQLVCSWNSVADAEMLDRNSMCGGGIRCFLWK